MVLPQESEHLCAAGLARQTLCFCDPRERVKMKLDWQVASRIMVLPQESKHLCAAGLVSRIITTIQMLRVVLPAWLILNVSRRRAALRTSEERP